MSRVLLTAGLLLLIPATSLADPRTVHPGNIPTGLFSRARTAPVNPACPNCGTGGQAGVGGLGTASAYPYGPTTGASPLHQQAWWDNHNCAPDGCLTPIGCGNFWTEFKFVFGSCRQFFGTGEASVGHHRSAVLRPPGR